jgi:hypothetical protein
MGRTPGTHVLALLKHDLYLKYRGLPFLPLLDFAELLQVNLHNFNSYSMFVLVIYLLEAIPLEDKVFCLWGVDASFV